MLRFPILLAGFPENIWPILILQQTSLPQHRRVIPLNALAGELVASKASEHFCQQLGYKARFYFDARVQRHIHKLWRLHSWYTT
jgi:hypothetical protein